MSEFGRGAVATYAGAEGCDPRRRMATSCVCSALKRATGLRALCITPGVCDPFHIGCSHHIAGSAMAF
jgi:hypothetical protein